MPFSLAQSTNKSLRSITRQYHSERMVRSKPKSFALSPAFNDPTRALSVVLSIALNWSQAALDSWPSTRNVGLNGYG